VSGSGISWAICKSAPCSRQTTTPAPHHSFFTGQMPFLLPNQQRQSTEGRIQYIHSCTKYTECQTNNSPIEYNCKISRQKTALTDTYTSAVKVALLASAAERRAAAPPPLSTHISCLHGARSAANPPRLVGQTDDRRGSRILPGRVSNPSERGTPPPIILTHVTGTKQFFGLIRNS